MSAAGCKLAGFAALLVLVFGVRGRGRRGGRAGPRGRATRARGDAAAHGQHGWPTAARPTAHGDEAARRSRQRADPIRGLAVAEDGLRLSLAATSLPRGTATTLRFAIRDARRPGARLRGRRTRSGCT